MADRSEEWAWARALYWDNFQRLGIESLGDYQARAEKSLINPRTVYLSIYCLKAYYDSTWADTFADVLAPVASYVGLKTEVSAPRIVEICPDAVAILQLGVGPYLDSETNVPDRVWKQICSQLKIPYNEGSFND